ncbi:Ribosomal protein S12 methylthiotransferase RimO [Bienertia sinuspersici]
MGHSTPTHHNRRLSNVQRLKILLWLLERQVNGVLKHGAVTEAAKHFNVARKTVSALWNTAKNQKAHNQPYNVDNKFIKCGKKRVECPTEKIIQLSMGQRTCIRDLSAMLGLSVTTIWRMIKRGLIKPHTNPIHPPMREDNKIERMRWVLSLLIGDSGHTKSKFYPMYNFVHLDEKWFDQTRKSQRYYRCANEKPKYRSASSSTNIQKVMFTAVVARPRYNEEGECTFDGKIGIFPFTYQEAAKRSSKNRGRGTMVTKIIKSITKDVTRDVLIHQIIPAIMEKWPQEEGTKTIYIQQDNAKTHIHQDDPIWQQHCNQGDFKFVLIQQPPNSPDLNILDLGFFRSIQSLMHKLMPTDENDLLEKVAQAFNELEPKKLSKVWMTLQYVMTRILQVKGGNDYDLPHNNKDRLEALGMLPEQVQANRWHVEECWDLVQAYQNRASTSRGPSS